MKKIEFKGLKLLSFVGILYAILLIFDFENGFISFQNFIGIIQKLLPIFVFIIILTATINYFLKPKQIMKHFGKDSGKKGIFYAVVGGILSHGPMYAWYPMLSDMKNHGLKDGLIATFMYARAIKLPLLPFMVGIFGITFTIIINVYILIFSILQGKIIDTLIDNKFKNKDKKMTENTNSQEQETMACDNDICVKRDECERYRLFKAGAKKYKTHNGKPHKGCGQFIKNTK